MDDAPKDKTFFSESLSSVKITPLFLMFDPQALRPRTQHTLLGRITTKRPSHIIIFSGIKSNIFT